MTLETALSVLQAAAVIGGAAVAVWKIAATTGALGREIQHLGRTIGDLTGVVQSISVELNAVATRVAVIEDRHRDGRC